MSDFTKGLIFGTILGISIALCATLVPLNDLLNYYKIGLIPASILTLIATIMSAKYKSKQNTQINKNSKNDKLEVRSYILFFQRFSFIPTFILIIGSWISFTYLLYLIIEYFRNKKWKN